MIKRLRLRIFWFLTGLVVGVRVILSVAGIKLSQPGPNYKSRYKEPNRSKSGSRLYDQICDICGKDKQYDLDGSRTFVCEDAKDDLHQGINVIKFKSSEDAQNVIQAAKNLVKKWGFLSRGDIYDLVGLPSNYQDSQVGWKTLDFIIIRIVKDEYWVQFPPTEQIPPIRL